MAVADDYAAIRAGLERLEDEKPRKSAPEVIGLAPDDDEELEQLTDLYIASALAGGFC